MAQPPRVTIVIPIYNEEAILRTAVAGLLDGLKDVTYTYEILLAENGSKDRTVEIANELSARFPTISTFSASEPNYGKALREGIGHARGEFIICDEIDLCDTDFYERALDLLFRDEADFVVGSKVMEGSNDERPPFRRFGTKVINGMLRVSLGFKGTDTHGLKAFRKQQVQPFVDACVVDKDLFASELVIRSERGGVRMREIPVRILEKRPPSIGLTKRVPAVLKHLARLIYAIRVKG